MTGNKEKLKTEKIPIKDGRRNRLRERQRERLREGRAREIKKLELYQNSGNKKAEITLTG